MNWSTDEPIEYQGVEESSRFEQLLFRGINWRPYFNLYYKPANWAI